MEPYFEDYLLNLGELHNGILNVLKDLPPEALDWSPGQDVNSLTVLVVHTVGSLRYWIGEVIAGDPANRDRDSEFKTRGLDADTLKQRLNDNLDYVRSVLEGLSVDDLAARRSRGLNGPDTTVAWILGHALKHTGTHLGHIQLMRQVWELYGSGG